MKHFLPIVYSAALIPFFAGCDYVEQHSTDSERSDRVYQAAMAEYAAGRLDKSIEGLKKVLKQNPKNASARFQLACLLQDHQKDPLGAICNYQEYIRLEEHGDKVSLAKNRTETCERQLAALLIKKYNLNGTVAQDETIARLRSDNETAVSNHAKVQKELETAQRDMESLRRENARLRRMMLTDDHASEDSDITRPSIQDLPPEDLAEETSADGDRVKLSSDVSNLILEESTETSEKSPFGNTVKKNDAPKNVLPPEPLHEKRPEYYTVEDGDTLFKLAIRFYGRKSAWKAIREANKTVVSSDGRIKAGDKLRLP